MITVTIGAVTVRVEVPEVEQALTYLVTEVTALRAEVAEIKAILVDTHPPPAGSIEFIVGPVREQAPKTQP